VRPKLACRACSRIVQAAAPSRPIERGLPTSALLAQVIGAKYADHCPLYRQEGIYRRSGVELPRSMLASWVGAAASLLDPLVGVLERYGISTPSTVIPTGIHLDEFRGGDGAAFRARHDIRPGQPTIVTVSRLAQEKNIGFLLRVAQRLVADFPDLCFVIAGEGPDAPRLKQLALELGIATNVRFFGNLDRRTILLDCYRAGDVFVFASPTETQGLVLAEAMALGVPIVSTAVMGTAMVLEGTRCARIAREDEAHFAEQVAALLRDPTARAALSAAGPEDAQRWSAPVLMQQVESLYAGLSAGRRNPAVAAG
jgi:glycosyltransferase involved in cell wall biosynthesis